MPKRTAARPWLDWYDSRKWRKLTAWHKAQPGNALCKMCEAKGLIAPVEVIDHITPHRGDAKLFWDQSNWQSLCASCHNGPKQHEEHRGYVKDIDVTGWPTDEWHPANARGMGTHAKVAGGGYALPRSTRSDRAALGVSTQRPKMISFF